MWFWVFIASAAFNLLFALYIRWLLKSVAAINEEIEQVYSSVSEFSSHLSSIHEMEMFYGDQTLKGLIDHASTLSSQLDNLDLILNEGDNEEEVPLGDETKE